MKMIKQCLATILLVSMGPAITHAQLAITEVMSSASVNLGATVVIPNSDFWELTNFGTNDVDLAGYSFNDNSGGLIGADPTPFTGLTIAAGESIIFVESTATGSRNAAQFRTWWGASLGANVQIVFYTGNGLSSNGDGVRVWAPDAVSNEDVVDSVDFVAALRGSSFIYNPATGGFGFLSTNGVGGAFKAETADDAGSPGVTTGPVPLSISQQPTNTSVNPGDNAVFSVVARGVPRAKFQWQYNEQDIPGARFSTLTVTNVQANKLGQYRVVLDNGAGTLISSNATLALNAAPEPPVVLQPPANANVFIGQSATFAVVASGVPQPGYQWRFNGTNVAGANASLYTFNNAQLSSAGVYSVVVSNTLGRVTNEATLVVTRRPRLVITEILPAQSTNGGFGGHNDWFELTNLDDFTVDLHGYRFDDGSAQLAAAITFTNHVLIAPGESIVFVEGMSVAQFRRWWRPLPDNLQIVSYSGSGLGLSSLGDGLVLWNGGATDDGDTLAAESFSTATAGVSFGFDPETELLGDLSVLGVNGTFAAVENGDIGSPGFIRTPLAARITRFAKETDGYSLTWIGRTNRDFKVEFNSELTDTGWSTLTNVHATTPIVTVNDPATGGGIGARFYRVTLQP